MSQRKHSHIVPLDVEPNQRLRNYLSNVFLLLPSNSSIKKAIKKKQVMINGLVGLSGTIVKPEDLIEYIEEVVKIDIDRIDPNVVYEDEHLIVVKKPAGLISSGNKAMSLQNILKSYAPCLLADALPYPFLVHRLDKQTSGLIVAARTLESRAGLFSRFEDSDIHKEYVCICQGYVDKEHEWIKSNIDDKKAITKILSIQHLKTKDPTSYLRIRIYTGRTHQIRIHLSSIGHPIVGDQVYNSEGISFGRGLFLASVFIEFTHPITKEQLTCELDNPNKFLKYLG